MTKYRVDPQALTLGEYAELEETLEQPLDQMLTGTGKWRAIAGMLWLLRRRDEPGYTFEEALNTPFAELELVNPEAPNPLEQGGVLPPSLLEDGRLTPTAS